VRVTGMTDDNALRERVQASLDGPAMPVAFEGTVEILQGPRILPVETVEAVLRAHADCGPLRQVDPPATGYPPGARVGIAGTVATGATRARLVDALVPIAGDRPVAVDTDVLNPELCLIHSRLPKAPPGGLGIEFGYGGSGEPNPAGTYTAGDNPVIDVEIPAEVTDGYLWVSIVDVTGNVFHLLPNVNRTDNSVASLRNGREGPVKVRVAYGLDEAQGDRSRLAFTVDETTGKSQVVVILSEGPLFAELQPGTESVEGYAEALEQRVSNGGAAVLSVDSRLIETR
jgi:serine/threonine-protein kinase